jgi:hypothetical protein
MSKMAATEDTEGLFTRFNTAAFGGSKRLREFRASWENPQTRQIFGRCQESLARSREMKGCEKVPVWGWEHAHEQFLKKIEAEPAKTENAEDGVGLDVDPEGEDEEKIVEKLKEAFSKLEWQDGVLDAEIGGLALRLAFTITKRFEAGQTQYSALCEGGNAEARSISKILAARKDQRDLKLLLVSVVYPLLAMLPLTPNRRHWWHTRTLERPRV